MDEMLKRLVLDATDESLFAWTDPKMVGRAYEKEAERLRREQEIVSGFIEKIRGLEEEVKRLCEERRADDIVRKAMELLAAAEDETVYRHPHDYDELFESIEQTMYEVVQALRMSGWSAADVLVWAVYLTRPYLGVHNPEVMYHLLSVPHGEYAAADTWREVAMRLQAEMDRFPKSEHGGRFSAIWHQAEEIMRAWEHAGEERNASGYLVKYVSRVMNWKEVVEFLMRHSMFEEAIRIAKEGIEASRANSNDYEYDYDDQLENLLIEAHRRNGDEGSAGV